MRQRKFIRLESSPLTRELLAKRTTLAGTQRLTRASGLVLGSHDWLVTTNSGIIRLVFLGLTPYV
jgi:hypothetical protein